MLSGALDPATPADDATTAARSVPNSRQVFIRNAAHEYFHDCPRDLVADFIARVRHASWTRAASNGCAGRRLSSPGRERSAGQHPRACAAASTSASVLWR
jgi:hypothetical protein